jgi:hypothetical protein
VTITKVSDHAVTLRSSPTVFADTPMSGSTDLDPHLNWQATKSDVKRGNAFGLVSHKFLPYCPVHDCRLPETAYNLSALLKAAANYNSKIYTQKFCRVI